MQLPTETKIQLKGQTVNASHRTQAPNRTLSAGSLGELGSPLYVRHRQGQSLSRKRPLEGHDEMKLCKVYCKQAGDRLWTAVSASLWMAQETSLILPRVGSQYLVPLQPAEKAPDSAPPYTSCKGELQPLLASSWQQSCMSPRSQSVPPNPRLRNDTAIKVKTFLTATR